MCEKDVFKAISQILSNVGVVSYTHLDVYKRQVFLDGGIDEAKSYIMRIMMPEIDIMKKSFRTLDCKTSLQEFIQKTSKSAVLYSIIAEKGPDHDKLFVSEVSHDGKVLGIGEGKSKKEAEQNAAYNALIALNKKK